MFQLSKKFSLNYDILKQCRKQIGYSIEDVEKKVSSIEKIENNEKRPTYKQLDTLAELYDVPRWVFISKELPPEYQYQQRSSFRRFSGSKIFDVAVRKLVNDAERYRNFFLELREEMQESVIPFSYGKVGPPSQVKKMTPQAVASLARRWLRMGDEDHLDFDQLRQKIEQKGVFVFLSNKHTGKGYIGKKKIFRGACLLHEVMPIIIINDSDIRKAQSFTLLHELGHLLRGDGVIDSWEEKDDKQERWCNDFAGNVLMTKEKFLEAVKKHKQKDEDFNLKIAKKIADIFHVSVYACLVRSRRVGIITQDLYDQLEKEWLKLSNNSPGFGNRRRDVEIKNQFGLPFIRTVFTAWHEKELNLVQVLRVLNCKRADYIFKLERELKV